MVEDIVRRKGYLTLGSRFRRIGERLQAEVQQVMDDRDVPIQASHYPLLGALDENGPLSIGDLAIALGVTQPGITRTVAQLAKLRFLAVRRGKSDQRIKIVELTALGRDLVRSGREDIWPQIQRCLENILEGQSGALLDQLDLLEDALKEKSLLKRITAGDGGGDNG